MKEVNLYEFILAALPYIYKNGYKKGTTSEYIVNNLYNMGEYADSDMYNRFLTWLNNKKETDYIKNIKSILSQEEIKSWQYNILCSGINSWVKSINDSKMSSLSDYVGQVGEKITLKVKDFRILSTKYFGNYYHNTEYNFYRIIGEDNNIYLWGTSTWVEKGDTVEGTVKDHKEYNGEKQTIITRGTIIQENSSSPEDDSFAYSKLLSDIYEN